MLWCVIPARNNSKGVPGKNWARFLDGSTCVGRALAMAERFAPAERRVLVADAHDFSKSPLALVLPQPRLCSEGGGSMLALLLHTAIEVRAEAEDWIMLLQPTSPFRTEATGLAVMEAFQLGGGFYDSICTAMPYPTKWHPAYQIDRDAHRRLPATRQALGAAYRPDGGYYLTTVANLYCCQGWGAMGFYETEPSEQLSIDTPKDWAEAERRIEGGA